MKQSAHSAWNLEPLERRLMMASHPSIAAGGTGVSPQSEIAVPLVAAPVAITVTGTAKWTDPSGGTHAIPLAYVEIRSTAQADTDPALATTQTDVNGNFSASLSFDTSTGASVFARIFARNPAADVKPDTGAGATTYYMNTSSGAVTTAGTVALPEKDGSNSVVAEESFSILGATLQAMSYATTLIFAAGSNAPSQLDVRFPSNTAVNGTASFFQPTSKQLFITQRRIADWDVIEHEYGHYVADRSGILTDVGGGHSFQQASPKPDGAGLAWNEGFADWFSISAQLNEPVSYAIGVPNEGDTSYNPLGPPAATNPVYNLATGTGVGELDEASVSSVLYHLAVGDEGITVKDTTMFSDFVTAMAGTFGAAYDSIAATMSGANRSLLGHVLGLQNIAPVETGPADFSTVTTSNIPTFTWTDTGDSNDFQLQFYTADYKTLLFTTPDLGSVNSYTPAAADWATIFDGHSTVKWFVEGESTTAPVTPGGVPDQTYSGTTLDRYWSQARSLNGPSIAIVLDVTGSMQPEIDSVEAGLVEYINNLQASLAPGEAPPTIDLVTFVDYPTTVISSNDLDAVKADIQEQTADGGGDIPEPSAVSLEYAAQDIAPGGTMLLITDAPSDAGSDLDGTIAQLRAEGVTVNADISGDDGYTDEPTDDGTDSVHSGSLASMSHEIPPVDAPTTPAGTVISSQAVYADSITEDDTDEPPQAAVTDAGQTPVDDVGNTPATATPLAVDGPIVHGFIGNQVQDPTGASVTDTDDYFSFNLIAGTTYNIPVLTDGDDNVTATWYGTDGMTSVTSGTTTVGDPGFGYETLTYTPTASGTYYLDVSQPDGPTGYTVQVSDNPLVGADSSVVLWTTTADATGGEFLYKPAIVNDSSDPSVATDYQASIVNVMDSTFEPTVLSATPNSLPAGTTLDVTLTGRKTNWIQGYSSVAFSAAGLTVNSVTVNSPTSITASVTVDPSAAANFSDVTVTTQLGSNTESAVGSNAVQVTAAETSATLLQVEPSTLARDSTESVKIVGTLTSWDSTSTLSLGPGVTVTGLSVVSATEIIATAQVAGDAAIGFRVATVTTSDTSAIDTQDMAITLTAAPVTAIATIASTTPDQVQLGAHVVLAVVGDNTNFVAGETTADFGPGVTVDSVAVTDATHATVTLDVSGTASAGFRNVVLTTGTESAAQLDGFLVSPAIPLVVTAPAVPATPMLPFQPVVYLPFTVTLAAAGTSTITVNYSTSDGNALAGQDYVASSGTLTIPAGQTTGTINVPLLAQDSSQVAKSFTLTLSNASGGASIGTGSATGSIAAITLTTMAFSAKTPLSYVDSKGQKVKVTLGGPGAGTAYFANGSADPADLAVTGTTVRSSLTVTGSVAAPAPIGGFGIAGPLASLTAAGTTLIGSSAIAGQVARVTLGTNTTSGDLFQLNGGAAPVSFSARSIDGLSVASVVPVRSFAVTSWASGTLTAPSVVSLSDKGNLGAGLTVNGNVGSVNVTGQITGGTWTLSGNLTSLKAARGILASWAASVAGSVGSVTAVSLAGSLSAGGSIKSVNITASLAGDLTAQSIGSVSVGGSATNSQIRAATSIASVRVGSIANSDVFAGVSSAIGTLPTAATDFTDPIGAILSFTSKSSDTFSNSHIAAATLKNLSIAGAVSTGAGGVAAEHYGAFVFSQKGSKPVKFSNKKPGAAVPTFTATDFALTVI